MKEKIHYLRILNNMTQAEAAEKLGVSITCISNWEKGIRLPNTCYIAKYAKLFNVDFEFFNEQKNPSNLYSFDFNLLNKEGIDTLYNFYSFLLRSKKYTDSHQQ